MHSWALVFQYSRPNRPYKRAKNKNMLTSRHIMKGPRRFHFQLTSVAQLLRGVYIRKLALARVSYPDEFFISYRVYIMTGSFHVSLFEGTLRVDKIHVRFKITNIMHALPVPVYQQTDFTPKLVVISRSHDTVTGFHTGLKCSPQYNNWGELTPG